jgi:hypothetical protein
MGSNEFIVHPEIVRGIQRQCYVCNSLLLKRLPANWISHRLIVKVTRSNETTNF